MKIEDTEAFRQWTAEPSKIKAQSGQLTHKNRLYHCAPLQWCTIL